MYHVNDISYRSLINYIGKSASDMTVGYFIYYALNTNTDADNRHCVNSMISIIIIIFIIIIIIIIIFLIIIIIIMTGIVFMALSS